MKILVINGHKYYPYAEGRLNMTMFDEIVRVLSLNNEIKKTVVEEGYDAGQEQEKFLWADVIIIQTPINWFSAPWILKQYIDSVYQHGIFFGPAEEYGRGGLLKGKKYMYSLTWNAPLEAFDKTGEFFDGRDVDDIIIALHKLQEYCAMEKIPTFSIHDVVKNPDIPKFKEMLKNHLEEYVLN